MTYCMPHGVPDAMTVAGIPFKILQMPGVTVLLFEEFHKYRQIHTDGRQLPVDAEQPAWYGYSIGQWEGDTFVVQTAGFKEGSWLDNNGHPHTEALRTTERFRRVNFGHMEVDVTIDDPKAYSRPWKSDTMRFTLQPDTELLEHLCENFEDEHRHLSCQVIEIPFRRYASERKESLLRITRVMKSGKHLSNSGNEPGITGTLPGKSGEVVFDTGKQVGKT